MLSLMIHTSVQPQPTCPQKKKAFQSSLEDHRKSAVENLQLLSQTWEWVLFSTGGAIIISKSFWVLVGWHWSNGKDNLITSEFSVDDLLLTEGYNIEELITVPRISPYTPYRILGLHISPSGSSITTTIILKEKSIDYATKISGSNLTREDALC